MDTGSPGDAALFNMLEQAKHELILAYEVTVEGLFRALELRNRETAGHSRRVAELALRLAHGMGLRDEQLVSIGRGALLHDIGKLGIPDAILYKPGVLTEEEWKVMKQHPALGYWLLSPIQFLRPALDIVYCHHEHWDGSGYPRALKGEQIPQTARLFSVVNAWDYLVANQPFRRGWSRDKANLYIKEQARIQFDPQMVQTFLALNRT